MFNLGEAFGFLTLTNTLHLSHYPHLPPTHIYIHIHMHVASIPLFKSPVSSKSVLPGAKYTYYANNLSYSSLLLDKII